MQLIELTNNGIGLLLDKEGVYILELEENITFGKENTQ